jgi:hypothetical protein
MSKEKVVQKLQIIFYMRGFDVFFFEWNLFSANMKGRNIIAIIPRIHFREKAVQKLQIIFHMRGFNLFFFTETY